MSNPIPTTFEEILEELRTVEAAIVANKQILVDSYTAYLEAEQKRDELTLRKAELSSALLSPSTAVAVTAE